MNPTQVMVALRYALVIGGTYFGWGVLDDATATNIAGALVTIGTTIWGLFANRNAGLVEKAETVPDVARITVTDPNLVLKGGNKVQIVGTP
jgi:hypothetical protein